MTRDTCRMPGCDETPRDGGGFAGRFCSDKCEVKYDHLKADAADARRAEQADCEPAPGRRP